MPVQKRHRPHYPSRSFSLATVPFPCKGLASLRDSHDEVGMAWQSQGGGFSSFHVPSDFRVFTAFVLHFLYLETGVKKVGILYHPLKEPAVKFAAQLETFLKGKGVAAWSCSAWESEAATASMDGTELIVTVGGDGTILRAAQVVIPARVPIVGINLGNLGFMTELSAAEAEGELEHLLAGEGWSDERALLEAEVHCAGVKQTNSFHALNDVVLARGDTVRVIQVNATVDGKPLTAYRADGVIIATATGSTGYAYAAGGPILHPHAREMVLAPIMPHFSASYRLVLPPGSTVGLRLQTGQPGTLTIDGHTNLSVESGTSVTVKLSRDVLRFLRIHPQTEFYSTLDRRLKGKQ